MSRSRAKFYDQPNINRYRLIRDANDNEMIDLDTTVEKCSLATLKQGLNKTSREREVGVGGRCQKDAWLCVTGKLRCAPVFDDSNFATSVADSPDSCTNNCLFAFQERTTHATAKEEAYDDVAALTVDAGHGECWRKQNVQRATASKRSCDQR